MYTCFYGILAEDLLMQLSTVASLHNTKISYDMFKSFVVLVNVGRNRSVPNDAFSATDL